MNTVRDLHICGLCKKIFTNIKSFFDHKSKCFIPENSTFLPSTEEIFVENVLFSNESALDLSVLDSASFPLSIIPYSNEEVVSDEISLHSGEDITLQNQLDKTILTNDVIRPNNIEEEEEDVATLLVNQLSKEVINKSPTLQRELDETNDEPAENAEELSAADLSGLDCDPVEEVVEVIRKNQKFKDICNVCNFETLHPRDLVRHMRKHTDNADELSGAELSGLDCDPVEEVVDKDQKHTNICNICNFETAHPRDFVQHMRKHTDNADELSAAELSGIDCDPVEEVVEMIHKNKKRKNICNVCNFETLHPRDLVRHMRKHTGERPYACCICDKKFSRQDKLVTHKRIHSGDKRYKCQLCNYATIDSGALRRHLRIHTDERPHKCQMCPYRARTVSHMTVHLRTHTGDSPFFCQLETCGRTFKTSTDLRRHMKVHKHDNMSPTYSCFDDTPERVSCKHLLQSGKQFNKSSSCYVCQNFTHKGMNKKRQASRGRRMRAMCVKTHECPHCDAAFVREDSLRSHMKLHQQRVSSPDETLKDKAFDGEEPEMETASVRCRSPVSPIEDLTSDLSAKRGTILLYVGNSDCLQDSLIPADQDGTVHYMMEHSFL